MEVRTEEPSSSDFQPDQHFTVSIYIYIKKKNEEEEEGGIKKVGSVGLISGLAHGDSWGWIGAAFNLKLMEVCLIQTDPQL